LLNIRNIINLYLIGIYLWSNKAFFGNVFLQDIPKRPHYLDLPNITDTESLKLTHRDFYDSKDKAHRLELEEQKVHSDQIDCAFEDLMKEDSGLRATKESEEMARISNDPFTKWQALYYIDIIKERNRPLDSKAKKQDAPFFLFDLDNALQGNDNTQDLYGVQYFTGKKEMDDEDKALTSIIQESKNFQTSERVGVGIELKDMLYSYDQKKITAYKLIEYFRNISPSAIELEFLSLSDFEFDTNKKIDYVSIISVISRSIHSYHSLKK
jgi:hypothetical protein